MVTNQRSKKVFRTTYQCHPWGMEENPPPLGGDFSSTLHKNTMDKIHQIENLSESLMEDMKSVEEKQEQIRKLSQEIDSLKHKALSGNACLDVGEIVEIRGDKYIITGQPAIGLSDTPSERIVWDIFYNVKRLKADGSVYKTACYGRNFRKISQAQLIAGAVKLFRDGDGQS